MPINYIRKKYIPMMKSKPMNNFIKEGGTYDTYSRAMLYHTFLVLMLGSPVLAKSVEEEVLSNERNILFRRDHSEWYTPRQTGEIMSEGIGTDRDVSKEGATLLYNPVGSDSFKKILYTHLSDDKKQDASTVRCNIEHVLNDLDEEERPRQLLNAIYDITDGCAVQYCCGQVHSLSQVASSWNVCFTRCVQAPGYGKEEVDGIVGTEKTYADSVFARPGRLAEEDGDDYKAQIHRMEADGTKSSLAKMMYDILSNPKRQFQYKEHTQKVKERRYHLRPHLLIMSK